MENYNSHLESILHLEIPLTKAIGIHVVSYTKDQLILSAPLENNVNHKNTAFGGSLYSVAVLAGWGLLYLRLRELNLNGHIVIQESEMQYIQPVSCDIFASCSIERASDFDRLIRTFKRKNIARVTLSSHIEQQERIAARFTGRYVVHA